MTITRRCTILFLFLALPLAWCGRDGTRVARNRNQNQNHNR
jgi:hypothetical protein